MERDGRQPQWLRPLVQDVLSYQPREYGFPELGGGDVPPLPDGPTIPVM